MQKGLNIEKKTEQDFESFLAALKAGQEEEWRWLVHHFRSRGIPWIRKNDGNLPSHAIVAVDYFIEEVFSESLIKFYELFEKGAFENMAGLRGLFFKIAALKLKEGYRSVKRDQRIYFPEKFQEVAENVETKDFSDHIKKEQQLVKQLEHQLAALPKEDREILLRYAKGEKLKDISAQMGISDQHGRKKKQRAMNKLKRLFSAQY